MKYWWAMQNLRGLSIEDAITLLRKEGSGLFLHWYYQDGVYSKPQYENNDRVNAYIENGIIQDILYIG